MQVQKSRYYAGIVHLKNLTDTFGLKLLLYLQRNENQQTYNADDTANSALHCLQNHDDYELLNILCALCLNDDKPSRQIHKTCCLHIESLSSLSKHSKSRLLHYPNYQLGYTI